MDSINKAQGSSGGGFGGFDAEGNASMNDPFAFGHDGAPAGDSAAQPSSTAYDKLQMGGSAIAALSKFGMSMNKARTMRDQAEDERMGAVQEYLSAQAASNEIQRQFGAVVGAQQSVAAAGNVDVASGSVREAGRQAGLEAGRAETKLRNMAIMNASQRRARMFALKQSAGVQTFTAWANLAMDGVKMAMGAPGGGGGGGMDPSSMMEAMG